MDAERNQEDNRFWLLFWALALIGFVVALNFAFVVWDDPEGGADMLREVSILGISNAVTLVGGIYAGSKRRTS